MDLSTSRGESENGSLLFILFLWAIWSSQTKTMKGYTIGFHEDYGNSVNDH